MLSPQSRRGRRPQAVAAVLLALLLSSCSGDGDAASLDPGEPSESSESSGSSGSPAESPAGTGTPSAAAAETYVALGDSFTAAPLVPTTDLTSGCLRSDSNYPQLVAAELDGYELVDVSCANADSASLIGVQLTGETQQLPQFDALDEDVDLVTIGIGGNDFGLYATLLSSCIQAAEGEVEGAPCTAAYRGRKGKELRDQLESIQGRVEAITVGIQDRAPDARVVVVTYPQLLPDRGSCPELVPLAAGDYRYVTRVNKALSDALAAGGRAGGADVADVYGASKGHDICSDEPWVNGITTDPERALAFHPFAEEQRAVADLVLDLL